MKHHGIAIPGYRIDANGKLVRSQKGVPVSKRIAQAKSRKRKVVARRRFGA
jgi:hypothetical protein